MLGFFRKKVEETRKVIFRMEVPISVREEDGKFYSSCEILDVHSQGNSEREAISNIVEALQVFVETCYEQGTLGEVLRSQGLMPGNGDEVPGRTVEVPLSLIARQHAAAHAH